MQEHEKITVSIPVFTPGGTEGGRICYSPAALGRKRFDKYQKALIKTLKTLSGATINPDGTGADPKSKEIIDAAEQQLFEALNYVCGVDTTGEAFGRYRPFAIMSRRFWAFYVAAALRTVVEGTKAGRSQNKKMRKRR